MVGAAALMCATLLPAGRAAAVQNWFGYGGVFGPQAYYTYYAPAESQPIPTGGNSGAAPSAPQPRVASRPAKADDSKQDLY